MSLVVLKKRKEDVGARRVGEVSTTLRTWSYLLRRVIIVVDQQLLHLAQDQFSEVDVYRRGTQASVDPFNFGPCIKGFITQPLS